MRTVWWCMEDTWWLIWLFFFLDSIWWNGRIKVQRFGRSPVWSRVLHRSFHLLYNGIHKWVSHKLKVRNQTPVVQITTIYISIYFFKGLFCSTIPILFFQALVVIGSGFNGQAHETCTVSNVCWAGGHFQRICPETSGPAGSCPGAGTDFSRRPKHLHRNTFHEVSGKPPNIVLLTYTVFLKIHSMCFIFFNLGSITAQKVELIPPLRMVSTRSWF